MNGMDLADFLLARIAEDQAVAATWNEEWIDPAGRDLPRDSHGHPIYAGRTKVLDECKAKRLIVEDQRGGRVLHDMVGEVTVTNRSDAPDVVEVNGEQMSTEEYEAVFTEPAPPTLVLRLLAMPYRDHLDYRHEWAP